MLCWVSYDGKAFHDFMPMQSLYDNISKRTSEYGGQRRTQNGEFLLGSWKEQGSMKVALCASIKLGL